MAGQSKTLPVFWSDAWHTMNGNPVVRLIQNLRLELVAAFPPWIPYSAPTATGASSASCGTGSKRTLTSFDRPGSCMVTP